MCVGEVIFASLGSSRGRHNRPSTPCGNAGTMSMRAQAVAANPSFFLVDALPCQEERRPLHPAGQIWSQWTATLVIMSCMNCSSWGHSTKSTDALPATDTTWLNSIGVSCRDQRLGSLQPECAAGQCYSFGLLFPSEGRSMSDCNLDNAPHRRSFAKALDKCTAHSTPRNKLTVNESPHVRSPPSPSAFGNSAQTTSSCRTGSCRAGKINLHLSAFLPLLLVGCATVQDLRRGPPTVTMTTPKPISDVVPCIVDAWVGLSTAFAHYDVRTLPRPNGGTTVLLSSPSSSLPVAFVDLERLEAMRDTKVNYYMQSTATIGGFNEAQQKTVRRCM